MCQRDTKIKWRIFGRQSTVKKLADRGLLSQA